MVAPHPSSVFHHSAGAVRFRSQLYDTARSLPFNLVSVALQMAMMDRTWTSVSWQSCRVKHPAPVPYCWHCRRLALTERMSLCTLVDTRVEKVHLD